MGVRVVKTAAATVAAIYLALLLQLTSAYSAGMFAIFGIDMTKKRGLRSVTVRFLASVLGLFVSGAVFMLFGFHVWAVGVYILVIYPVLYKMELQEGIVTSAVVTLHLLTAGELTWGLIWNEIVLLAVGLGTATVINLVYLPNPYGRLEEVKRSLEDSFSAIFIEIARHLADPDRVWSGKEVLAAAVDVEEGTKLADHVSENSLFQTDGEWERYFEMRNQQLLSIGRMLDLVSQVYQSLPHGLAVADLFKELSEDVKRPVYTGIVEEQLNGLEKEFKRMPLPDTRHEFEVRSAILQLCLELRTYLSAARALKRKPAKSLNRREK